MHRPLILAAFMAVAAPVSNADAPLFAEHAESSSVSVDYRSLSAFAQSFGVEEQGRFKIAYDLVEGRGAAPLASYIRYLSGIRVEALSRDDQLAYWLNLRNLLVVQAIAEDGSRRSLKKSRGEGATPGALWTAPRVTVGGQTLSIDDIERRVILAGWDTPNVLYGLYQGVDGSPAFYAQGYRGETVHDRLAAQASDFINSRDGLRVKKDRFEHSALYDWYFDAAFGGDAEAFKAHLANHLDDRDAQRVQAATSYKARKFDFGVERYVVRRQPVAGGFGGGGGGGGGFGS